MGYQVARHGSWRRLSSLHLPRGLRWVLAGALAVTAMATSTAAVLADCGNVALATLDGDYQLQVTVLAPTGSVPNPTAFSVYPLGHQAVDMYHFGATCPAPGQCSALLTQPGTGNSEVYSLKSGFFGGFSDTVLTQSGATYTATFRGGGVGGPNLPPCSPPLEFDTYKLTLTVLQATAIPGGTGWHAAVLSGVLDAPGYWGCNGNVGFVTSVNHLGLVAVPVGASIPADVTRLACNATPAPVAAAPVSAAPSPAGTTIGAPGHSGGSGGTGPGVERSTIASALPSPAQAFPSVGPALVNALITLGIILFITFPSHLFNHTFEENYEEIKEIAERRLAPLVALRRRMRSVRLSERRRQVAIFGAVVLAGAVLGGLNDPSFGFNEHSAATYLAVLLAVLFGVSVSASVGFVYRRARKRDTTAALKALPAGLVVAAVCVVVSRVTAFQPGYLYGVICGAAFTTKLARHEEGHNVALGAIATLVLGVVAWLAWVPVNDAASSTGAGFGTVVLDDFLGSVFVGGLVGSVIGLMPLKFLPGGTLAEWDRRVWAAMFGIAVFGLVQVMLRPESTGAHPGHAPLVTAIALFVVFGGASLAFRGYFVAREKRKRALAPS